jgi:hypothetical protein
MSAIKAILTWIIGVLFGMQGGQGKIGGKSLRRFGLPILATGYALSVRWDWRYLAFLLFIPVLCLGYGVDSHLGAILGHVEWLIRAVYATLLSLPFFAFGWRRWLMAVICLIVAFQIHAGSLGQIPYFGDFLIEDLIRYGTLMALVIFNVLVHRDK